MNKHIQTGKETPLQGNLHARERPMREGAYSIQNVLRARLFDVDGFPISGKARVIMGEDGKPEKLVMSGVVPGSDVMEARTGKGAYHLVLAKEQGSNGKDDLCIRMRKACGPDFEYELKVSSAMVVRGGVQYSDDDDILMWPDLEDSRHLEDIAGELEAIAKGMGKERKAPAREEILFAEFRFNDGSRICGRALFGEKMEIAKEGVMKAGRREYLTLQVKGCVNAVIAQCSLANLTDVNARFVNIAADMNAFTVEIGGKAYSGKIY